MSKPSLRNKGQSLAEKVDKTRHRSHIDNRIDWLHATRARRDTLWGAAASDLEARANKVRLEQGRARKLEGYAKAVHAGRRTRPPRRTTPRPLAAEASHWLGFCLRCDASMWTFSSKPKVPICCRCALQAPRTPRRTREMEVSS